jgi:L-methionine (R)-S-oxide reductase
MTDTEKTDAYSKVEERIVTILGTEQNPITVMAVVASILKESFSHFYWVGFLLVESEEMLLGPFQGPPACLRLPLNSSGVCGTCYRTARTVLVPDVAAFNGRVGCDVVSKSEIAVPIIKSDRVVAVLDVDTTEPGGVDEIDQANLEQISRFIASRIRPVTWP